MKKLLAGIVFLAILFSFPSFLRAQDSSSMTGVVTDVTGAVLPGTVVTLTNPATGTTFTQTSDSKGSYRFANVPPAQNYNASFTHAGFATVKVLNLTLQVGITRTQDASLQSGASVSVEVSATNSQVTINTTDATIGNNLDVKLLNDLPIQNRATGITTLFTLQPGYANGSFTGARTDQSSVTVDGLDVNNVSNGQNLAIVAGAPVDSVQEFRGTVGGLTAAQGTGSGGQFQLVTKSGTNTYHGSLFEYHRDTSTVANTWFNNNVGLPRTPLIRNQFGGSLGGTIIKDKLFFFVNSTNDRIVSSVSTSRTVPTPSFLAGNLSYINNGAGCGSSSRSNTTGSCISTLTSAQVAALDPKKIGFSAPLLTLLNGRYGNLKTGVYDPTGGDGVNTELYRFTLKQPSSTYAYVGRIDYNLSSTQRLFARFTVSHVDQTQTSNEFPGDPFTSPYTDRSYAYVVSHIWQIGRNKVNQFYYGDTVDEENFGNLYNPGGTTSLSFSKYVAGFLSAPYTNGSTQERRVPVPEIRDDFNWQIGAHNINVGGTFKFVKTNSQLVNDLNFVTVGLSPNTTLSRAQAPSNAYLSGTTAVYDYFGAFNVALGSIAEVDSNYNYDTAGKPTQQGTGARRAYRFYQTELYAGDTWKVTPRLTLDYGVRYQLYSVPYETKGNESYQNLSYQQLLAARVTQSSSGVAGNTSLPLSTFVLGGKANNGPNTYSPSYKDLAPRVAFAYSATPKTVINASAGLVFDRTVVNAVDFIQDQSSQLFQQAINTPYTSGYSNPRLLAAGSGSIIPNFANPNPAGTITHPYTPNIDNSGNINPTLAYPSGLATNSFATIIDPNLKTPYSINFNVGLQQEFPDHFIMRLNYVGRMGRRLLAQADASQLIDFVDTKSNTSMGAAVANLEGQVRNGATAATVKPVAWFENVMGSRGSYSGADYGYANNTALAVDFFGSLLQKGDFADFIQGLAAEGTLPANVGLASQFAGATYVENGGFSSYNGLLLTLTKNLSHGLQFDLNYTWSHSVDNTSQVANSIASGSGYGFLCDILRPRECRANSDFDVTNVINADFVYDLPFGRKRSFASNSPRWLDTVIGGWQVSGIPQYRGGFALTTSTTSFVAGYANNAPAIFTGNPRDVKVKATKTGSAVNAYQNPTALLTQFAYPTGFTIGSRNAFRGPSSFGMDGGLAKTFPLYLDRVNLRFRADFFNILNHPVFNSPNTDISQSTGPFGAITSTASSPRVGQFALRLEF
jgi:hypothetical protein